MHFYQDLMGFDLLANFGTAAFLSAGGYHHHIGLNTWESKDASLHRVARLVCIILPLTIQPAAISRQR